MTAVARPDDRIDSTLRHLAGARLLGPAEERRCLRVLDSCRRALVDGLADGDGGGGGGAAGDPHAISRTIAEAHARGAFTRGRLAAAYRRYCALRWRLALGNLRLVAHVARRYRDRGVAYADLLQEGVCGLLEAIDRFDVSHPTRLATYATWWIRQAVQQAVAGGAYPVRLSPRHLRQLAEHQDELDAPAARDPADPSLATLRRIHTATRPSVSLDGGREAGPGLRLVETLGAAPAPDGADDAESLGRLLEWLRPRERQVLSLRFGLGGAAPLSLSQVGELLDVSKERVRQIQGRALEKLRVASRDDAALGGGPPGRAPS